MSWDKDFRRNRSRLMETAEFSGLLSAGHHLKDGVVLTSISDAPIEMSFKCAICEGVFWFRRVLNGETSQWRFNPDFSSALTQACPLRGSIGLQRGGFIEGDLQFQGSGEAREAVGRVAARV